jgi:hypothetical protein
MFGYAFFHHFWIRVWIQTDPIPKLPMDLEQLTALSSPIWDDSPKEYQKRGVLVKYV